MNRWAVLAMTVLLGVSGFLGWKVVSLDADLDDALGALDAKERASDAVSTRLDEANEGLSHAQTQAEIASEEMNKLQKRLSHSQYCRGPRLWVFPKEAGVGDTVSFVGNCFIGPIYGSEKVLLRGYGLFLIRQLGDSPATECEQIVGTRPLEAKLNADGTIEGTFTVGSEGNCFQHDEGPRPVVPGVYRIGLGCHACRARASLTILP